MRRLAVIFAPAAWFLGAGVSAALSLLTLYWAAMTASLIIRVCDNKFSLFSSFSRCRWPVVLELCGFVLAAVAVMSALLGIIASKLRSHTSSHPPYRGR